MPPADRVGVVLMRMDVLTNLVADDGNGGREVGAVVARAQPAGGIALEVGPADGPPVVRFSLSTAEATRFCATVQAVINGRDEEIMMMDD